MHYEEKDDKIFVVLFCLKCEFLVLKHRKSVIMDDMRYFLIEDYFL